MSCIFCDIVSGKVPAKKVYEKDYVLAFHDVEPQAPVHVLVVCKEHIANVSEIEEEKFFLVQEIFKAINELAKTLNLKDGFRVVNNCGKKAGQTVDHMHFHVLAGRDFLWPPG